MAAGPPDTLLSGAVPYCGFITATADVAPGDIAQMNVTSFNINLNSHQMDAMTAFYSETLGLKQDPYSMGYEVTPGVQIHLDGHSEISAATKEPARVLVNFMVDDLAAEQSALEAKGVKFIRTAGVEEWGGKYLYVPRPGWQLPPDHGVPPRSWLRRCDELIDSSSSSRYCGGSQW